MGITVTKKVGKAHIRNRIRRRIKEAYRLMEPDVKKGYNFVIVARLRANEATYWDLKRDIEYLFNKSGLGVNPKEVL